MAGFELIDDNELNEIIDIFKNGGVFFRHGFESLRNECFKVAQFEREFAKKLGVKNSLAVTSGTAALRVALAALDIGAGDEVIAPSFTFVATVEAIIESGATPVCCEIDQSLNMDPSDLERLITNKTKAIIAVHMLGTPADLVPILDVCKKYGLFLIEDTAWGCGGRLNGKPLGTWGDVGTFSFDYAKTITTGEGGMVVCKSEKIHNKAAAWHDHGHENNPLVPRWEDTRSSPGFNFRMTELQGAVGLAQLRKLEKIINLQRHNKDKIVKELRKIGGLNFRKEPEKTFDTADALVIFAPDREIALQCRENLLRENLGTKILPEAYSWHFAATWEHLPQLAQSHGNNLKNAFPRSHAIISKAVSIPINVFMDEDIPEKVSRAVGGAFLGKKL